MAVTIAMELDRSRFESILCATRTVEGESFTRQLREAGVRVLSLERRSKFDLLAWRPLVSLLRPERVGVLHAHKFGSIVYPSSLPTSRAGPPQSSPGQAHAFGPSWIAR